MNEENVSSVDSLVVEGWREFLWLFRGQNKVDVDKWECVSKNSLLMFVRRLKRHVDITKDFLLMNIYESSGLGIQKIMRFLHRKHWETKIIFLLKLIFHCKNYYLCNSDSLQKRYIHVFYFSDKSNLMKDLKKLWSRASSVAPQDLFSLVNL